jgi:hypothetical protein
MDKINENLKSEGIRCGREISKLITEVVSNNFSVAYSDNVIKIFCKQNSVKNILKKTRQNVEYFVVKTKKGDNRCCWDKEK